MKKFITAISIQTKDLIKFEYIAEEGAKLQYKTHNSFPILPAIYNAVEKGEKIEIVPILINNKIQAQATLNNYEIFKEQLAVLSEEKGFTYEICSPVKKEEDDSYNTLVDTFSKLIDKVNDKDELYACVTYGTKPVSILTIMALNYAYKVKNDVLVKQIVYGTPRWDKSKSNDEQVGQIYDLTPLFYIDSSMEILAKMKLEKPESLLRTLLGFDEE